MNFDRNVEKAIGSTSDDQEIPYSSENPGGNQYSVIGGTLLTSGKSESGNEGIQTGGDDFGRVIGSNNQEKEVPFLSTHHANNVSNDNMP